MAQVIRHEKAQIPRSMGFGTVEKNVPVVKCDCGREVFCDKFTNTCECGRDFNCFGQSLAPRSQWGEETGESLSDILQIA